MDACVSRQRHLCVVECKGHVRLLTAELSKVGADFDDVSVTEVFVCIHFTEVSFSNVGVTELSHFVSSLEGVTEGKIAIIDVVRVTNCKGPAGRRRSWNRLVDTLNPPLEDFASIQRSREPEGRPDEGIR